MADTRRAVGRRVRRPPAARSGEAPVPQGGPLYAGQPRGTPRFRSKRSCAVRDRMPRRRARRRLTHGRLKSWMRCEVRQTSRRTFIASASASAASAAAAPRPRPDLGDQQRLLGWSGRGDGEGTVAAAWRRSRRSRSAGDQRYLVEGRRSGHDGSFMEIAARRPTTSQRARPPWRGPGCRASRRRAGMALPASPRARVGARSCRPDRA